MEFEYSDRCKDLRVKLLAFMDEFIYPNENAYKDEVDRNGQEKGNRWLATVIVPAGRAQRAQRRCPESCYAAAAGPGARAGYGDTVRAR